VGQDAGLSPDPSPEIDGLGEGEMQPALLALSQHELIERPEDKDVDSLEPLDRRLRGNVAIQEVRQPLPRVHDVADAALRVIGLDDLPGSVGEFDNEPLPDRVLGEGLEVELAVGDSQLESRNTFDALDDRKVGHVIAWRRMKGGANPPDALTVRDRIDVEGPEWKRVVYRRMRAMSESVNGGVKSRLAYGRLTWQGLGNASIHVSIVMCVVYAAVIAAALVGRPELRYSIAHFA